MNKKKTKQLPRYYFQLTQGCGNIHCHYKLCASCLQFKKVTLDMARLLSIQLASTKQDTLLCPRLKEKSLSSLFNAENKHPNTAKAAVSSTIYSPFLNSILSMTSLSNLFEPRLENKETLMDNIVEKSEKNTKNAPEWDKTESVQPPLSLFSQTPKVMRNLKTNLKISIKSYSDDNLPVLFNPFQPKSQSLSLVKNSRAPPTFCSKLLESSSQESLDSLIENEDLKEFQLSFLTLDLFERAYITYEATKKDPSFLLNTLKVVFSSRMRLSSSFLSTQNSCKLHSSGLDLPSLSLFYEKLYLLDDIFQNTFQDAIDLLLEKFLRNVQVLQEEKMARVLLIVLKVRFLNCNTLILPLKRF
jgi:hypothetical protein